MIGYNWFVPGLNPKAEDKYNFTFDNEVFENISFKSIEPYEGFRVYYIGNMSFMGSSYEDTGEDYFLYLANNVIICATQGEEEEEHTVALELVEPVVETVHKLDNKYLDLPYETQGDTLLFSKSIELPEDADLYFGRSAHSLVETINNLNISTYNNKSAIYDNTNAITAVKDALDNMTTSGSLYSGVSNGSYSTSQDRLATGTNSWVGNAAAEPEDYLKGRISNAVLSVVQTQTGKSTFTTIALQLDAANTDAAAYNHNKIKDYPYLKVKFKDDGIYYNIKVQNVWLSVEQVKISFEFVDDTKFSVETTANGRIIESIMGYLTLEDDTGIELLVPYISQLSVADLNEYSGSIHVQVNNYATINYFNDTYGEKYLGIQFEGQSEFYFVKAHYIGSVSNNIIPIYFDFLPNKDKIESSENGRLIQRINLYEKLGTNSHSENTSAALGNNSHAEGDNTISKGEAQHTQGKYNIIDDENKYAHIIGNGTDEDNRSNAHTVDWEGNGWFAGTVEALDGVIIKSSTTDSTKRFKITVDDSGTISAVEI